MFDLLKMAGTYKARNVANFAKNDLVVDTSSVTDGYKPFESGITHPQYNQGKWIIVEDYGTKKEAQIGHDKWVAIMTNKKLPAQLVVSGGGDLNPQGKVYPRIVPAEKVTA